MKILDIDAYGARFITCIIPIPHNFITCRSHFTPFTLRYCIYADFTPASPTPPKLPANTDIELLLCNAVMLRASILMHAIGTLL